MSEPYKTWEIRTKTNLLVRVNQFYDECTTAPWIEYDGHGIVSKWASRDKRAGELILDKYIGQYLYYDLQETMKKARREGWGVGREDNEGKTKGQIAYEAVMRDFKHLQAWCIHKWWYCGVSATVIEDWMGNDVSDMDIGASLWGIEDGCGEYGRNAESYIKEVAEDLTCEAEYNYLEQAGELWRLHFVETLDKIDKNEEEIWSINVGVRCV